MVGARIGTSYHLVCFNVYVCIVYIVFRLNNCDGTARRRCQSKKTTYLYVPVEGASTNDKG